MKPASELITKSQSPRAAMGSQVVKHHTMELRMEKSEWDNKGLDSVREQGSQTRLPTNIMVTRGDSSTSSRDSLAAC